MNKAGTIGVLENVSGELGGISRVLTRIQYTVRVLEYKLLTTDLERQIFLLEEQIRRIDNLTYKLEVEEDAKE